MKITGIELLQGIKDGNCDCESFKLMKPLYDLDDKYNTLNKDIDELIKKYEDYIRYWENEIYKNPILIIDYKQFIQDLKKLKGE